MPLTYPRGNNGPFASPTTSPPLTATGSSQTTALALSETFNYVFSVLPDTGVILSSDVFQVVANAGNNDLNVYPPIGQSFSGYGENVPFILSPEKCVAFVSFYPLIIYPVFGSPGVFS